MRRSRRAVALTCAAPLLLGACGGLRDGNPTESLALKVVSIELGRVVGADKRVLEHTARFSPGDTVYASVVTEGNVDLAVLEAHWSRGDTLVGEARQQIASDGDAVTEFHVFDPSGLPPGTYRVDVLLDGTPVGSREFTVEAAT